MNWAQSQFLPYSIFLYPVSSCYPLNSIKFAYLLPVMCFSMHLLVPNSDFTLQTNNLIMLFLNAAFNFQVLTFFFCLAIHLFTLFRSWVIFHHPNYRNSSTCQILSFLHSWFHYHSLLWFTRQSISYCIF